MTDKELCYKWVAGENEHSRIYDFLCEVDSDFVPTLSERVNLVDYAKKLALRADNFFVVLDGIDVASCSIYCNEVVAYISSIAVKSSFRLQHIGRRMMEEIQRHAIQRGCDRIRLEVDRENTSALLFYRVCGFSQCEERENWVIMEKVLNNEKQPKVSIILPTYNRAITLGQSIESVLAQTYPWFELLIIDDGSTDDTEKLVNSYQDDRIFYHKLGQNKGQSVARNYGMRLAKYEYMAFEDSDDIWYPDKLRCQMGAMLQAPPEVGMVYHKIKYEVEGCGMLIVPDEHVSLDKKSGDIYAQLLWQNMIGMPTLLVKKSCVEEIGYLDEDLRCLEDYDWVLRIAKKYHAIFLDKVLLDAGYSTTGVSGQSYRYVAASCTIVQKYKQDYLATGMLNHRLECILTDAAKLGIQEQIIQLLEKIMQM